MEVCDRAAPDRPDGRFPSAGCPSWIRLNAVESVGEWLVGFSSAGESALKRYRMTPATPSAGHRGDLVGRGLAADHFSVRCSAGFANGTRKRMGMSSVCSRSWLSTRAQRASS